MLCKSHRSWTFIKKNSNIQKQKTALHKAPGLLVNLWHFTSVSETWKSLHEHDMADSEHTKVFVRSLPKKAPRETTVKQGTLAGQVSHFTFYPVPPPKRIRLPFPAMSSDLLVYPSLPKIRMLPFSASYSKLHFYALMRANVSKETFIFLLIELIISHFKLKNTKS